MKDKVWSVLAAILVVTIVYMLVRPSSPAAKAIEDIGNALTNLVQTAVNGPQDQQQSSSSNSSGTFLA